MFPFLPFFTIAQTPPTPQEIVRPQEVRPLPGQLNNIPVFNSNSPEVVIEEGILLSTFPPNNKTTPTAHLNYPLQGRFDIFAHHISKATEENGLRTLYLGILLHNPTGEPVTIDVLPAATYLSQPDAPFIELPSKLPNPTGSVYAGPGSRVMSDILRGMRQESIPDQLVIPPGESRMLLNVPIPISTLEPPINGRSTYIRLNSDGEVYAASLAMFAPIDRGGNELQPTLQEWERVLENGKLATPRDRVPTPPDSSESSFIYGRVAGVAKGSQWQAELIDNPDNRTLSIPAPGNVFSYGISTLDRGTLGTNQIQSAPMIVRYPDTAYKAHGNYGVQYSLTLPLYNPTNENREVAIALETPVKQDQITDGLRFFDPLPRQIFFRGTVEVRYNDEQGLPRTEYFHLVQRRGQEAEPLVTLTIPPNAQELVYVDFLYPPDATPPQVLTVKTLSGN